MDFEFREASKPRPSQEITKGFLLPSLGQGFVFGKTKKGLMLPVF
jgi:hypothetical protein